MTSLDFVVRRSSFVVRRSSSAELDETARRVNSEKENLKPRNINKIFGIGFNKTGSTTLEAIFKDCGFSVPEQQEQEVALRHIIDSGDWSVLRDFVARFDAFQDIPFSQNHTFICCDVLFPNSKFILTTRNADEWYESLTRYHKKVFGFDSIESLDESFFKDKSLYLHKNYVYEATRRHLMEVRDHKVTINWSLLYQPDHYKAMFEQRNIDVIKYFSSRPNDLLVIDITKEKDTRKIVEFLNLDDSQISPMPHVNKT